MTPDHSQAVGVPTAITPTPDGPNSRRSSIKDHDNSVGDARSKRKQALRELGRQHRQALLQQHRLSLSPLELEGKLHAGTMAAIRSQLQQPEPDGGKLTEADITALLDEMEQQVLQEIQAELEQWSQMEQHAREEERQAGINLEQHQQFVSTAGEGAVLCPVCRRSHLVLRHGLLVCPAEGWRLNVAAEGIHMDAVRTRLAAAYEQHAPSGCRGTLNFHIEDLFGQDSLVCSCTTCNYLAVVV